MIYYHTCVINYATDYKYYILYLQILLLFDSILSKTPLLNLQLPKVKSQHHVPSDLRLLGYKYV